MSDSTPTFDEEVRAAREAEAATLWDDAIAHYEAALTQLPPSADEAELLTALGACYWNLSEARTAWRTLRRAIALYAERGDGRGVATATLAILRIWGPPERQREMADAALNALGDGDPHLRAWLLARMWRLDEAWRLADEHGFDDVRIIQISEDGWAALKRGDVDTGVARLREAHTRYAAIGHHQPAADMLRMAGFNLLQSGRIDDGDRVAAEAVTYARSVHLRFQEQLAQLDRVGVAFTRCEFDRCEALLGELTNNTDFRAGRTDAARREMDAWAEVARAYGSMPDEAPALLDCLVGLGTDELVREVSEAYAGQDYRTHNAYSTLQGRGMDEVRGALALRLGDLDAAERWLRDGATWSAEQRCPLDEARCIEGLATVARTRGDASAAREQFTAARAIFAAHGAQFYVRRVDAEFTSLGG